MCIITDNQMQHLYIPPQNSSDKIMYFFLSLHTQPIPKKPETPQIIVGKVHATTSNKFHRNTTTMAFYPRSLI